MLPARVNVNEKYKTATHARRAILITVRVRATGARLSSKCLYIDLSAKQGGHVSVLSVVQLLE